MRRLILTLALAAALPGGTALAQDRPSNLLPTRDVAVTYRILGAPQQPGVPQNPELTISTLAAERKTRSDINMIPGVVAYGITDIGTGRTDVVIESMRMVMQNAGGADMARYLRMAETARFTRQGTATYAGQTCTNWRVENGNDRGTSCITADGVMLRASNEQGQGMEATRVEYAAQDPARFRVPQGYQTVTPQQMMQGLGGAMGGQPRR